MLGILVKSGILNPVAHTDSAKSLFFWYVIVPFCFNFKPMEN